MRRGTWLVLPLLVVAAAPPAIAQRRGDGPVLHEPIPPDPGDDVALAVALDGDLPAAIDTPRGLVPAPDPGRPVGPGESPYGPGARGDVPEQAFHPDRDTRRPDVLPYDDPFSPSTAPFKRTSAFDAVDASYTLSVRVPHTSLLPVSAQPPPDRGEELFYADMVVDLAAGAKVRIPSVGPGARVLRARAGNGAEDARISLYRDGADNWFVSGERTAKVRLVMELAIPRAAFGGDFGNPTWPELGAVPPLPANADRSAAEVAAKIGASRRLSPKENVSKLVDYFRGFAESEEPPSSSRDVYLDLALSKKGVCRHRAFAFLVTALHLGLPTRMVLNEAHAWVEVHDGRLWRRIDLGGAGRMLHDPLSRNAYEPPADPFGWPHGATRGDDLAGRARQATAPGGPSGASSGEPPGSTAPPNGAPSASPSALQSPFGPASPGLAPMGRPRANMSSGVSGDGPASPGNVGPNGSAPDDRPSSQLTMTLAASEARRGAPLRIRGSVVADGEACGHVSVQVYLHSRTAGDVPLGILATDEGGRYDGAIVLPVTVPLGDYDVAARTFGDARCGRGHTR